MKTISVAISVARSIALSVAIGGGGVAPPGEIPANAIIDPDTGEYFTDPETGEYIIDPEV